MIREPIFAAVFAKLNAMTKFNTVSRRLRHWSDVHAGEMPAAFIIQRQEVAEYKRATPIRWTLHADIYIYANETDLSKSPSQVLNPLMDAVCAAFTPDVVTGTVLLGGLVYTCRVSGTIATDEGVLGDLAVAIIPIEIVVPD